MTTRPKWERCIYHLGADAERFLKEYLSDDGRRVLLIGGAGFDPRTTIVPELLAKLPVGEARGYFLREQRPSPDPELLRRAAANETRLRGLLSCRFEDLEIFAPDDAVIGGRTAIALVKGIDLQGITDVIVDLSALSIGVAFPIVRYFHETSTTKTNLHLVLVDDPATDVRIRSTSSESPTTVHGFKGGWELDAQADAAKLWMPQLSLTKKDVLDRIHSRVAPHAVCPILPFPATVPRLADTLIEHYGTLLQIPWQVDARDIIYASERSPVDLYRTILRIDDARRPVFAETGGSQIILSPVGSKALAIGALMAALDRDFTVMYIESLNYSADFDQEYEARSREQSQFVHVWLQGEAYRMPSREVPQQ